MAGCCSTCSPSLYHDVLWRTVVVVLASMDIVAAAILTKPVLKIYNILSSLLDLGFMRSNTTEIKTTIAAKFMFIIISNITSRALDF